MSNQKQSSNLGNFYALSFPITKNCSKCRIQSEDPFKGLKLSNKKCINKRPVAKV